MFKRKISVGEGLVHGAIGFMSKFKWTARIIILGIGEQKAITVLPSLSEPCRTWSTRGISAHFLDQAISQRHTGHNRFAIEEPNEDLADLVDCINDVVGMQAPAASTLAIASTSRSSESSEVAVLTKQVAMLTEKIDIMSQKSCRSRNRNRWCQQLKIDEFTLCVYATPTVLVSLKLRRTSCDYQPAGNAKGNH